MIEHVAVLVEPDQDIQPADIPVYDDAGESGGDRPSLLPVNDEPYHAAKERVVAHFEKEYFARLVSRAGGTCRRRRLAEWTDHALPSHGQAPHPRDERGGDAESGDGPGRSRCFAGCSTKPRSTSWTTGMSSGRMPPPVRTSSRRWALTNALKAALDGGAEDVQELATLSAPAAARPPAQPHDLAGAEEPPRRARAARHSARLRTGRAAARAQLGSAICRPAHRPRRTRAGGGAGARPPFSPHLDPVSARR